MIDDWVNKGHTNLNMFSVVGEQIRSLSSKQSKLNFWNQLHPKIAFLCPGHKQLPDTKPYNLDIKCKSNSESYDRHGFFGTKFRGSQNFVLTVGGFFNEREYFGADWLVPILSIDEAINMSIHSLKYHKLFFARLVYFWGKIANVQNIFL